MIGLVIAGFVGYACGCIPFANLVARRHGVADLRSVGDRNPGYWNARQRLGSRSALPVLVLDGAKGVAGAAAGLMIAGIWGGVIGWTAAIVGHMFPLTMRFRGGRGILCFAGGAIVMAPLACAVAIVALLIVRWRWDFARGIQVALIAAPFATWIIYGAGVELFATVALLVLISARSGLADRALKRAGIDKHYAD